MKKVIAALLATSIVIPATANARTPQQELHAYLVGQARKSNECPRFPALKEFCNPKSVSGTAKDAAEALRYMRNVDRLGILCAGGDLNACLRQGAMRDAANGLGWCAQPSRGLNMENVTLWARCTPAVIYVPKK